MSRLRVDRQLWLALLLLVGAGLLLEYTAIDLWVQDLFYNPTSKTWLVDQQAPLGRIFFYNGPKGLVWVISLGVLTLALGPARWREKWQLNRRGLWLAVLVLATVPLLAGIGKEYTNTFCPSEVRRYGGDVAYVKLCEPFPAEDRPARRGGCFPAGHASGGFALMGLLLVRPTRRWRLNTVTFGLILGWWMGGYQMLKGAHYLSHTVTTMLVAWLVIIVWRQLLGLARIQQVKG
ncbi:MAG: phosphatase PAP2 family protein [Opitutaceae bacterium]